MKQGELIQKDISVGDIEALYRRVVNGVGAIKIPNSFKSQRIGLVPRLSQFFITIEKRFNKKLMLPWIKIDDPKSLDGVFSDPACLTAILMADEVFVDQNVPVKKELGRAFLKRFSEPVYSGSRKVQLFAVDHSIEKYARPDCFYLEDGGVKVPRSPSYYTEMIREYLSEFSKNKPLSIEDYNWFGDLMAELIDNTDQHARSDYLSGRSDRSVRAVILNLHLILTGQEIESVCGESGAIYSYVKSVRKNNRPLHLMEISIFDSGPGIYRTFSRKESAISVDEEAKIVLRSFIDGVTSKINGIGVGRGLSRARNILSERFGFISVRTGRISIYRDYKGFPISADADSDIAFFDEVTGKSDKFTEMYNVEGVAYSILVPLK